jgi:hypothetical protein
LSEAKLLPVEDVSPYRRSIPAGQVIVPKETNSNALPRILVEVAINDPVTGKECDEGELKKARE